MSERPDRTKKKYSQLLTDSHEWRQNGSDDGRRLNQHRKTSSHDDRKVSIDVRRLVDDANRQSHQQTVQDVDEEEQADEEHTNGKHHDDTSRDLIILDGSIGLEKDGASSGFLAATNETDLLAFGDSGFSRLAQDGIESTTFAARSGTISYGDNQLGVGLDDTLSDGRNVLLDRTGPSRLITAFI